MYIYEVVLHGRRVGKIYMTNEVRIGETIIIRKMEDPVDEFKELGSPGRDDWSLIFKVEECWHDQERPKVYLVGKLDHSVAKLPPWVK